MSLQEYFDVISAIDNEDLVTLKSIVSAGMSQRIGAYAIARAASKEYYYMVNYLIDNGVGLIGDKLDSDIFVSLIMDNADISAYKFILDLGYTPTDILLNKQAFRSLMESKRDDVMALLNEHDIL